MSKDKKMLFEAMHKVGGMPLNEDMYTDDQVTQNFDNWHNPEQGPDMDTNDVDNGMSSEEFLAAMEKFQENDRESLKKMNPNDSWYNFFAQSIEARQKLIDSTKKQAGINEEVTEGGEIINIGKELNSLILQIQGARRKISDYAGAVGTYEGAPWLGTLEQFYNKVERTLHDYYVETYTPIEDEYVAASAKWSQNNEPKIDSNGEDFGSDM